MSKYCVIGQTLPHTLSPFLYQQLGLDYGVVELPTEKDLFDFVQRKEYVGYNVTIPYKISIIKHLDYIDEVADKVGAVNTVINKDGKSYGYNTDVEGMRLAFKKAGISIWGQNVMILGSGGTAATARYFAKTEAAASIVTVSRKGPVNYENCYDYNCTDIIINTTPVGMFPNVGLSPIELSRFPRLNGVYDAVYNPMKTKLAEDAARINIPCANGLYMLVSQAKRSAEIYLGKNLDVTIADDLYIESLLAHKNLVLVGMPGSGKTTIGALLAKKMNREFIDIDAEIESYMGKSIPDIFKEDGEERFRDVEELILNQTSSRLGQVIATGGGVILREENVEAIKRNGYIVWIRRDVTELELTGRPLSKSLDELRRIQTDRLHLYALASDCSIKNNLNNYDIVDIIKEIFISDICRSK